MRSTVQEATETAAQTKTEAAKGDQAAMRKLAREQAAHQEQSAPPSANVVDSDQGKPDVKAEREAVGDKSANGAN